uniref:Uncharacterized protein n=1 Tax=Anopheles christyi TaxID=43041 RepID=A0A182JXD0_9DIPT
MAIFCLVLATAAFVLVGGPQACRCDRPPTDGDGLDGNIWKNIRDRLLTGDVDNNLISAAKLPHTIAPTFAWNQRPPIPTEPMFLQSLINRYRKYMVERFVRFDDACSLLFGAEAVTGEDETTDNDNGEPTQNVDEANRRTAAEGPPMDGSVGGATDGRGESFRPEINASNSMIEIPTYDVCSRNAKQYYRCLLERFSDRQLMDMVQNYLETYCSGVRRDPFVPTSTVGLHKRDTPRYVSKQKFHSWGGKRNTAQVFYPWGGKRTMPRTHKQPKVVIRNPFHSWGGKRSDSSSA